MRTLHRLWIVVSTSLLALAHAATPQPPAAQTVIDALNRANASVVGVQVMAAAGARSAETLGRERSGSGVVIGPDGLVLTIGYLLLEADTVQITTQDNKTLPARAVAYDLATGFGLLRPLLPLRGVAPVPLGSHTDAATGEAMMVATGGEDGDVNMTSWSASGRFRAIGNTTLSQPCSPARLWATTAARRCSTSAASCWALAACL
jgi:serine protease Do